MGSCKHCNMVPVVIAAAIWGWKWAGQDSKISSMAVVNALLAGTARDPHLMHLVPAIIYRKRQVRDMHGWCLEYTR